MSFNSAAKAEIKKILLELLAELGITPETPPAPAAQTEDSVGGGQQPPPPPGGDG